MDKPWLLTREEFNNMRGDETALLYLTVKRILHAQHLKTLEWLEKKMAHEYVGSLKHATPIGFTIKDWEWQEWLAQARKDVADG